MKIENSILWSRLNTIFKKHFTYSICLQNKAQHNFPAIFIELLESEYKTAEIAEQNQLMFSCINTFFLVIIEIFQHEIIRRA